MERLDSLEDSDGCRLRQRHVNSLEHLLAEGDETNLLNSGCGVSEGVDRYGDGVVERPTLHTRADDRESDADGPEVVSDGEASLIARHQQFALTLVTGMARAHGVDHPVSGQRTCRRPSGIPNIQALGEACDAITQDLRAAVAMDSPVHTPRSPTHQNVGSVDDRVDFLFRDVSEDADDVGHGHSLSCMASTSTCSGVGLRPSRAHFPM